MLTHPAKLVWVHGGRINMHVVVVLVLWGFFCILKVAALANMCICTGLSELSLLDNSANTEISFGGSIAN